MLIDIAEVVSVLAEEILQARIDPAARIDSIGVMRNDDSHLPSGRRCITPLAIALAILGIPR